MPAEIDRFSLFPFRHGSNTQGDHVVHALRLRQQFPGPRLVLGIQDRMR
jgi:hypothetical protein